MIIKIKDLKTILKSEFSLEERGMLITIIMLKDANPKLTLAKVKAEIKISKHKQSFIKFHEMGLIDWSGYKAAKKQVLSIDVQPDVLEVINFMNVLYNRNFNAKSESTIKFLRQRLKEHSKETVKLVAANRYEVWKNDPLMSQYLTPQTIFRPSKFDKYLVEVQATQKGSSLVQVDKISLKKGSEIDLKTVAKLNTSDPISVRILTFENGRKIGSGRVVRKKPSDLEKTIKTMNKKTTKILYEGK